MSNMRRLARKAGKAGRAAALGPPHRRAYCSCGWQLPTMTGVKFDDPSMGETTAFVLALICPVCEKLHESRDAEPEATGERREESEAPMRAQTTL